MGVISLTKKTTMLRATRPKMNPLKERNMDLKNLLMRKVNDKMENVNE